MTKIATVIPAFLTRDEVDLLLEVAGTCDWYRGLVGSDRTYRPEFRDVDVALVDDPAEIDRRLIDQMAWTARSAWDIRTDPPAYAGRLQLQKYRAGHHHRPHVDAPTVAVTATLCLAVPEEGGQLIVADNAVYMVPGDLAIYLSSARHEVTRVTAGERLVAMRFLPRKGRREETRQMVDEATLATLKHPLPPA